MINPNAKLNSNIFTENPLEQKPTREGFGRGLVVAGEKDERVVGVCADLAESTKMHYFKEKFPERYIEVGVAEQNLVTLASGLANYGKIPFVTSYATFSPGRNWEQIRTTIAINNVPVKIVGSHAGISVGPDGATHQALEDIALMRVLPNMIVINPCDSIEAEKATLAIATNNKPSYLRLGRSNTPVFTTPETPFEIGKGQIFFDTTLPVVGIISTGALTYNAVEAAFELEKVGIAVKVLHIATIKPLDVEAVIALARECGAIVSVEEHQVVGGLGGAVAEVLAQNFPVPQEFIGVKDMFGQSGEPTQLLKHYKMDTVSIKKSVEKVLLRKK
jgi:transketolase